MSYPVYYPEESDTLPHLFGSYDGGTGASITLTGLATTDIEIYKDGGTTTRASDNGYALLGVDGIDEFGVGIHGFSVDLSDNSDAGFYAVGSWYHAVINAVTIDGQTVRFVAFAFRIVSATRGLAGTALPDAAADAAGGLPISDAGGLDMDAILVDTNSLNDTKIPDTLSLANINAEVDTAIVTYGLDHFVQTSVIGTDIADNSIIARLVSASATADWDSFDNTTDALEAIRNKLTDIETDTAEIGAAGSGLTSVGIGTNGIVATSIATGAITAAKFAANAVTSTVVADGFITAAKFAANAINEPAIAANAITASKIATAAIGSAQIAADAIGSSELATTAVNEIRDAILADSTAFNGADIAAILLDTAEIGAAGAGLTDITDRLPGPLTSGTADSGTDTTLVDAARTEADTDYWKGCWLQFTSGTISGEVRLITGFTPASDTLTFAPATTQAVSTNTYRILPAAHVMGAGGTELNLTTSGNIGIDWANIENPTTAVDLAGTDIQLCDTITTYTGNTVQTGDNFARLGAPAGASVSADVAAVKTETAAILLDTGTDGVVLTAAERNSVADALLDRADGIEPASAGTERTVREALRIILSASAGKLSGAATTTVAIRDLNDSKDVISATVDSDGNRTAVTIIDT